jgi:hypothetical protein
MTWQLVPTFDDPYYTETVSFEGSAYQLTFAFNLRESAWHMSIAMDDGTMLAAGLKLVTLWPITRRIADPRMPPGEFIVFPNNGDTSTPGLEDLVAGGRCSLVYIPSSDLP